jgi:pyrroloquinoline quinone (PQQ) biosynthesis protein C/quercetin dioxygenase-like cupin family protein
MLDQQIPATQPTRRATDGELQSMVQAHEAPRRRDTDQLETALPKLRGLMEGHPFWENKLFKACAAGHLTLEDFRFVFGQYYLYNKNFTRYLSALMTNCENDYFRARLAENLWEEGGALAPEQRHAEIFRKFLREGLGLELEAIVYQDYARHFASQYLDFCIKSGPAAGSAFLSLGTEAIVSRMYTIFVEGLEKAGVPAEHLAFFRIHIGCDDEHAETLEQMMASYFDAREWFAVCREAMEYALDLRAAFFNNLYASIEQRRVQPLVDRIQARQSLLPPGPKAKLVHRPSEAGEALYRNQHESLNIDFSVERVAFGAEVLDPRLVRIPAGRFNEKHRHAHETIFFIVSGSGRVVVDERETPVGPGDIVFVPRWAFHQTQNTGPGEMTILAVTDFGLTSKAFIGDYLKTARLKQPAKTMRVTTALVPAAGVFKQELKGR